MSNRIREIRLAHGMTLVEVSQKISQFLGSKISPDLLGKYERGDRKPNFAVMGTLSGIFGVPISYLDGTKTIEDIVKDGAIDELKKKKFYFSAPKDKYGITAAELNNYIDDAFNKPLIQLLLSDKATKEPSLKETTLNDRVEAAVHEIVGDVFIHTETDNFSIPGLLSYFYSSVDQLDNEIDLEDLTDITAQQKNNICEIRPEIGSILKNAKKEIINLAKDKNYIYYERDFDRFCFKKRQAK